jgi:hypothetical protein
LFLFNAPQRLVYDAYPKGYAIYTVLSVVIFLLL